MFCLVTYVQQQMCISCHCMLNCLMHTRATYTTINVRFFKYNNVPVYLSIVLFLTGKFAKSVFQLTGQGILVSVSSVELPF